MRFFLSFFLLINAGFVCYGLEVPLEVKRVHTKSKLPVPNNPEYRIQHYPSKPTVPRARYTFYPGSLRANIIHVAREFGWPNVVWLPNYDYHWVGKTKFASTNIKDLLRRILHNYPLQAVFYEGNHVLVISSRNIS